MGFEKMAVPLRDIVPSGQNPRRDFGDIKALAAAIEATGGEPVNPPVVVRDGNVYRIVDGERRYRALRELHKGDDGFEATVLAADGMDAANELVAMLATDDKQPLTEEERARGVQQMLVLGVDTERIERSSRATRGQIAAARMVGAAVPEGAQVTLDQMLAASEFSDEADVEAVLGAGEAWRTKVSDIRRREKMERLMERAREALAAAGVPLVDEAPEGMKIVARWYKGSLKDLEDKLDGLDGTCRAHDAGYEVDLYAPEGFAAAAVDPDKADRDRERAACADLFERILRWVVDPRGGAGRAAEVEQAVRAARRPPFAVADSHIDGLEAEWEAWASKKVPGAYEIGVWIARKAYDRLNNGVSATWRDAASTAGRAREALDLIDVVRIAGFEPGGDDRWLVERLLGLADAGGR